MKFSPLWIVPVLILYLVAGCQPIPATTPKSNTQPVSDVATVTPRMDTSEIASPTDTEEPTTLPAGTNTPTATFTATPKAQIEYLTPYKIKIGDFNLEISIKLSASELKFQADSRFPTRILKSYPNENTPPPVKDVEIKVKDVQVEVKQFGGGGGGGGDEEITGMGQEIAYRITPTLPKGKKVHITAIVSFNEYLGIDGPVPFEYDLIVR